MSENCNHECSGCTESCEEHDTQSLLKPLHEGASVGKVIAVVSGKGGVGKSLVTGLLAAEMQRRGHRAAVLDADVTGPSIPRMFGVNVRAMGGDDYILPVASGSGIQLISMNVLLENETDPVVWRGPVIAGAVEQFWTDVIWDDVDYMFVDMPPGTGDVPLTVFQSLPVDGIIIVTSPQELVSMIVGKAVHMSEMMQKKVLATVENMSYFMCPDCGKKHSIFGESSIDAIAADYGIKQVAKLPVDPSFAAACDAGEVESLRVEGLTALCDYLESGNY
ncbi:MAG: Mrp/NBP35 family ATP-binding protein [Oscillospiraceae bacterium]